MEVPYHGEATCGVLKKDGKACSNKAYYAINGDTPVYACGVHSKPNNRTTLIENPRKGEIIQERIATAQSEAERIAHINQHEGKRGQVIVSQLKVMKTPEQVKGFILVFPNHSDKNRIIGLGMPELSPMDITINHSQPDLPPTTLENFHQGNKCYLSESVDGEPSAIFFENQKKMYEDDKPHRHKILCWLTDEEKKALKQEKKTEKNKKAEKPTEQEKDRVLYSVFWKDGKMLKLNYAEGRQLYCELYEAVVRELPEYQKLRNLMLDGFNLQICGYDGYPITKTLREHYADLDRPFGHELVLASMLMNDMDATVDLPWRH